MQNRVGNLIKESRIKTSMSQKKIARLCRLNSSQYISNTELGKSALSVTMAKRLGKVLNITGVQFRTAMVKDYAEKLKRKWKNKK